MLYLSPVISALALVAAFPSHLLLRGSVRVLRTFGQMWYVLGRIK